MTASGKIRISPEMFHGMLGHGLLDEDKRFELLEGEVYEMEPIGPFHAFHGSRIQDRLYEAVQKQAVMWSQYPIALPDGSQPIPDLSLLVPPIERYESRLPRPDEVLLVVEIANSSLLLDRTRKARMYAQAGIPEYWIANLPERTLEVHRQPVSDRYEVREVAPFGTRITLEALPGVTLEV